MHMVTPQQIALIRKALKESPNQFAYRMGVSENTVRRWEIGDRHPRWDTMVKLNQIAKELGVDLAEAVPA